MIPEQLMKIFDSHPILGTILILASMFFFTVWWKDWPENLFSATLGASDEEEEDEEEETKYSVNWQQTRINMGPNGFPESVEGTFTIKKEED